jgi:uncharacterized repeat protein (TIGR03803 family)
MKVFYALALSLFGSLCFSTPALAQDATLTVLASFNGTNGSIPWASVVLASDGNFYGTTYAGGASGHFDLDNQSAGTVFRVTPDGVLTCLASFVGTNGSHPRGALIEGADGNLYGTTQEGGACPDYGPYPFSSDNSSPGLGTVFRITKDGMFTTVLSFWGTNGSMPATALVKAPDGTMYGTTRNGGDYDTGTIFNITTNGNLTLVYSFGPLDYSGPMSPLILASDGILYGNMTYGLNGPPWLQDVVFRMNPPGNLSPIASLTDANRLSKLGGLCESRDGSFYGVSETGGAFSHGAVWRVTKDGGQATVSSFPDSGNIPFGGVIEGTDGNVYGIRNDLDTNQMGVIYSVSPDGAYRTIWSFNLTNGGAPAATLIQAPDGNFYGTTQAGGAYPGTNGYGFGTVFRLSVPSAAAPKIRPLVKTENGTTLQWSSIKTRHYQIEYRTNLNSGQWQDSGINVTATNGIAAASDENSTDDQRFYRVVMVP